MFISFVKYEVFSRLFLPPLPCKQKRFQCLWDKGLESVSINEFANVLQLTAKRAEKKYRKRKPRHEFF